MEVYRIDSDNLSRIAEKEMSSEQALENDLVRSDGAEIGGVEVLYIDRQGSPGEGGIFDIVGVDGQGDVVLIELKRGRSPRDIVAQALEYAASIRNEDYEQLASRYQEFIEDDDDDAPLRAKHTEFFERSEDPLSKREYNTDQRLLLVGKEFSDLSLDMADFLREHGIDVICVTYSSFATEDGDLQLLTTEGIRRPLSEEPSSISGPSKEAIVDILDEGSVIKTFKERNQSDVMEQVVNYLIDEHNLLNQVSIPFIPGHGDRALINNTPTHPDDGSEMGESRELNNGYYLLTRLNARTKGRYLNILARKCGLNVRIEM